MSSIHFNNQYDYGNYETQYDFSSLLGSNTQTSGNVLSDYASIKNGSYGKLLKSYYAKMDADGASSSKDTTQKLTLMRSSADSLKKSADALKDASLWEKKKITKTDEKNGEKTQEEDYDWDAITKAVKSFINDYNSVVEEAGNSETKDVLRNASWMTNITSNTQNLLSKVGITIGKGNKLELDEEALKNARMTDLKTLFTGSGSFADKISQKAAGISSAAARTKGAAYVKNGAYSDGISKLFSSTIDEKIGNKKTDKKTENKEENKTSKTNSGRVDEKA